MVVLVSALSDLDTLLKDVTVDVHAEMSAKASSLSLDIEVLHADQVHKVHSSNLVNGEEQPIKFTNLFFRRFYKPIDLDAIATKQSVFDDPDLAPHSQ
jgi:hypothetical protein